MRSAELVCYSQWLWSLLGAGRGGKLIPLHSWQLLEPPPLHCNFCLGSLLKSAGYELFQNYPSKPPPLTTDETELRVLFQRSCSAPPHAPPR